MGTIRSHRDLLVWQRSMDLVERCYALSSRFPGSEQYRLTSQLLRASASVPANIAEGHSRDSTKAYLSFLSVARGSLAETETFLLLAVRLHFCTQDQASPLFEDIEHISRMLTSLQSKLRAKHRTSPTRPDSTRPDPTRLTSDP
jgi:four helix bundle protein